MRDRDDYRYTDGVQYGVLDRALRDLKADYDTKFHEASERLSRIEQLMHQHLGEQKGQNTMIRILIALAAVLVGLAGLAGSLVTTAVHDIVGL